MELDNLERLKDLGLGIYEIKILEVLFKEKTNLRNLSKKSGVPFGKVYSVVKSLKKRGLIKEDSNRPKKIFVESASEVIKNLVRKDEKRRQELWDKLKILSSEIDVKKKNETPFFQIGINSEENAKIQSRVFDECEKEVLQILNIFHKPKSNRVSKTKWEKAIEKAVKRGVVFKSIYPKKTELPKLIKKIKRDFPKKFIVKHKDTSFVRCDIVDGKKVLLKLVQQDAMQFGGIIFIENERFAKHLKKIFYGLWEE